MSKRGRGDDKEEEEYPLFWANEQERWFELLLSAINTYDPPISPDKKFTLRIQVMGDVCLLPKMDPRVKITADVSVDVNVKVTLSIAHWKQLRLGFVKFCSQICKQLEEELDRGFSGGCEKSVLNYEAHPSYTSFFATFYSVRK